MSQELLEDPIQEPIKEILALFTTELSEVTFPDISSKILETYAEQVRTKALELQELQTMVLNAKESLEASQNELLQKATRGLAYAKVYAEDREELSEKLNAISLSAKTSSVRKKSAKSDTTENNDTESSAEKKSRQKRTAAADTATVNNDE